jgi:hypothetical protein
VNSYIDFTAFGQTVLFSLLAVLLVTGSFAVGARSYVSGQGARAAARPAVGRFAAAVFCFAVAAAGVAVGVWFILDK